MKKLLFFTILSMNIAFAGAQQSDSAVIKSFYNSALSSDTAYNNLEYLCTKIGGRLCGSPQAAAAVEWSKQLLKIMKLDTVYTQSVMVHHWVRGEKETASVASKVHGSMDVHICALGESIGTPADGLTAEIVEVNSLEQLKKLGKKQITGKIVFFNKVMNPTFVNTFEAYGDAYWTRGHGAVEAARYGAVGVVIRSLTLSNDYSVHTGIMRYDTAVTKIPAVAISTKDADMLSEWLKDDYELLFHFKTSCKMYPETESFNVIGEIKGSVHPDEIITIGGHLDAWELGQGAQDDGVGCMHTIEVMRLFKELKIVPQHTIRLVLFMDEECAQRGARKYAAVVKEKKEKQIAAIESDEGGFVPTGFTMDASADTVAMINKWKNLFLPYNIFNFSKGYSGVDVGFLRGQGIPLFGLETDSQRYFISHHGDTDTFDRVNKRELQLGCATIASLVYLIDKDGIK